MQSGKQINRKTTEMGVKPFTDGVTPEYYFISLEITGREMSLAMKS